MMGTTTRRLAVAPRSAAASRLAVRRWALIFPLVLFLLGVLRCVSRRVAHGDGLVCLLLLVLCVVFHWSSA